MTTEPLTDERRAEILATIKQAICARYGADTYTGTNDGNPVFLLGPGTDGPCFEVAITEITDDDQPVAEGPGGEGFASRPF